jgi:arylsulfatase A
MKIILPFLFAIGLPSAQAAGLPNFIVVLGEGAGWASTSVQMDDRYPGSKGTGVRTPNFERFAAAGMRFSDAYSASPRCTPSRAALFTGKSPAQLHMTFVHEGARGSSGQAAEGKLITPSALTELPETETTIGELLKRAGYATAHFGKWHVGRVHPSEHGFDESDGPTNNGGPDNVAAPNPKQALAITARGIQFMERQVQNHKPFYLQLSHYPNQPDRGAVKHPPPRAADDIAIVDQTLGQILDAVDRLRLRGTTYVIYSTDHGAPGRNSPLTGGKGTVWEGGLRVPFFVTGPDIKAGTCSHVRVTGMDVFPTIAELGQVQEALPAGIEGGSFAALLKNGGIGDVKRPRPEFVVHFPHYDRDGPASALYLANFKLIHTYENGGTKLFDVVSDPCERHELTRESAALAKDLDARLSAYLKAMNAQMPKLNANYTPSNQGRAQDPDASGRRTPQ